MRGALLKAATMSGRRTAARPAELAALAIMMAAVVVGLTSVWHAVLGRSGRAIGEYDWRAIAWYLVFAEAGTVPVARIVETVGRQISSGEIAVAMLRPVSVIGLSLALETGATLVRQCVCLLTGCAIALVLVGGPPDLVHLALAVVALPVAVLINLLLQHVLGAIAFWAHDARSTWFLYQKLVLIGGGVLIPLDLLPSPLASILEALPFAAVAYIPGHLAAGRGDARLVAYQCCWLAVALVGGAVLFARGQRRLEVLGG